MEKVQKKYKQMPLTLKVAFWYMVCNFLQKGISTLTTPIFTRLMSTEQYGQYTLFVSWQSILLVIISLKLAGGVYQQGLVKYEDRKDEFTSSLMGLSTTLVSFFFVVYLLFRDYFNDLFGFNTTIMCAMFASILATCAFDLWAYRQRMEFKYIPMVIVTIVVGFAKPISGILAVLSTVDKGTSRILSLVAVEVAAYSVLYIAIFKKNSTFYSKEFWKTAITFNLPLIPHFLSQTILIQSDRIMIKKLCGSSFVGIYGLAYSISMLMSLVNNAVKDTLNPWIYKSIKTKDYKQLKKISEDVILIIAVVDMLVIVLAPELIKIFAPPEYYNAIWIIPPVSMSIYFTFLYCFFADFEYYYEATKFIMVASIFSALLNVGLNYIFIEQYGYIAAGYTTLVCYIVYTILHYLCYKHIVVRELKNEKIYNIKKIAIISALFIVCGFAITMTYDLILPRMTIFCTIIIFLLIKCNTMIHTFKLTRVDHEKY